MNFDYKSKMGHASTYFECISSVLECGMLCGDIMAFDFQERGESCLMIQNYSN